MTGNSKRKGAAADTLHDNRLRRAFERLWADGGKAFIPFVAACDPDLSTCVELVLEMARLGATVVELGVPFSDPIADGPTIQAAFTRVLESGFEVDQALEVVRRVRRQSEVPLVLMVSYSIVLRRGVTAFLRDAAGAGVDGFIIPDLPAEAADQVCRVAEAQGLTMTFLVTPATPSERIEEIARLSTGFVYYVSVMGITGARTELPKTLAAQVKKVKQKIDRPVCIGFGISSPEQVRRLSGAADGLICGSAIVRRIDEAVEKGTSPVKSVSRFVKSMIEAL